jgi:glucose-6-phosphate isomerase
MVLDPFFTDAPSPTAAEESVEVQRTIRRLSDLAGCFGSEPDFTALISRNPEIYTVLQVSDGSSNKSLLSGWCLLQPGKVGAEFYMTRGHNHRLPRAEVYYCVSGHGMLLTQFESLSHIIELVPGRLAYVPAQWAHRHVNIGSEMLVTSFAVSADAGHDYDFVANHPFRLRVFDRAGEVSVE